MKSLSNLLFKDECEKHYLFKRTLGEGSFATVRLAVSKKNNSKWAIKCIDRQALKPGDETVLESEVRVMKAIDHPNIIKLHAVYDCPKTFYMVMELCTGGELFDRIVEKSFYTEMEAKNCFRQLAEAIKYCHQHHIVHRDLKPENLIYASPDDDAVLKLADFGLAQIVEDETMMRAACGTPGYVAPEIVKSIPYNSKVDVWSCGVILYILLCGFPPFYEDSTQLLFRKIQRAEFDYPSPFWDETSEEAKDLINHMLVVDPEERFSIEQVLDHPWMNEHKEEHNQELTHFKASLRKYNYKRKFKAGVMALQVINAMGGPGSMARRFKEAGERKEEGKEEEEEEVKEEQEVQQQEEVQQEES
jgi:calcium/calmodulin-dependent protein kinase I